MASMRDIKRRRQSIQSTQQIAKAMKLVATVKLQRARQRVERSQLYFQSLHATITSIFEKMEDIEHKYMSPREDGKKAVIVISSNRGLAGGYNSNVVRLITRGVMKKDSLDIYAVGKKGRDALKNLYNLKQDYSGCIEDPTYADAMCISKDVLDAYRDGEVSEIHIAYTAFINTIVHEPMTVKLLPFDSEEHRERMELSKRRRKEADTKEEVIPEEFDCPSMNFEPEAQQALDILIPNYITCLIYSGMLEAVASENGARMTAMDSAANNAEDMIEDLSLLYNRARQASITQELTEIIGGANAIS
ncbi:MAG: ATP synthase F1 subunit gamma [Lachnospiraceae bacterium]|jgi:F-type H+-transporting ATPase subunit gamma|nr:ATP synthase F1 subunit gamma [Lachnospiraceae bacterium]